MKREKVMRNLLKISSIVLMIVLLTGAIMTVNGIDKKNLGAYKNETYQLTGLKNPDGSTVRGINYTPLYNYCWFVGAME